MNIYSYFQQAIERGASDLHLVAGSTPVLRIDGELIKLSDKPLDPDDLKKAALSLIFGKGREKFKREKELDISQEFFGHRFRINLHFQEGKVGLAARLIAKIVPIAEKIGFNNTIIKLADLRDGLVLVTGPSGSGKSTTLAALIDIINQNKKSHIITIEDPIEFLFEEKQSIIEQREVGIDTKNFITGLKYALRQDPNVIMVGEMRDRETISAALTAAETGHLVISTLHSISAPDAIERMVDVFSSHQQKQILSQLSSVLRAVVSQQLLPKISGGLVAAREIMVNNRAVANLIKTGQIAQIYSVIQTSSREGMIGMNKAIEQLVIQGIISKEVGENRMRDLTTMASYG